MENQIDGVSTPQSPKKPNVILWIVIIIVVAVAVGAGVYFWQKTNTDKTKKDLNARITDLEKQIADTNSDSVATTYDENSWKTIIPSNCQSFFDGCNNCTRNEAGGAGCTKKGCKEYQKPTCSDSTDSRTLVTSISIQELCHSEMNCPENSKWNNDDSTTTVKYINDEKGIGVDLPWNPRWGTDGYRINPYEERSDINYGSVLFGPMVPDEGGVGRARYNLSFPNHRSSNVIIDELTRNDANEFNFTPALININGHEVIKYAATGMGTFYEMIVLGSKYDYEIYFHDYEEYSESNFSKIQSIVESIQLL